MMVEMWRLRSAKGSRNEFRNFQWNYPSDDTSDLHPRCD
jgi:hypothetical protein